MDNETKNSGQPNAQKHQRAGFDKDQPGRSPGQRQNDGSPADDRRSREDAIDNPQAIPDLPEPDVEGVGKEEGYDGQVPAPPGEGQAPKRNP